MISKDGSKPLFEQQLEGYAICYHKTKVATPRQNGKVERQHRIDEEQFYRKKRMYGLKGGSRQLQKYITGALLR